MKHLYGTGKMIYFDNAATMPLDEIAIDALKEYGVEKFFNPSALYREALENTKTLNAARENILKIMQAARKPTIWRFTA